MVHFLSAMQHHVTADMVRDVALSHRGGVHQLGQHFAQYLPLRIVQTTFEMPSIVEMLCWPRHLEHDPAHQWLRDILFEQEE
jgi:hypothetical protein